MLTLIWLQYVYEVSILLTHSLFWNLSAYWSVYMIINNNPALLQVCFIFSKLKHIWCVAILFSVGVFQNN